MILLILIILLVFGGGGLWVDGPTRGPYYGGGLGLIVLILLVLYLAGALPGLGRLR